MSFKDAIETILPPSYKNGKVYNPAITTGSDGYKQDFYAPRNRKGKWDLHKGVDINYHHDNGAPVGQNGINKEHPSIHSPVTGKVTDFDPKWGMVEVTDELGYRHQFWHMDTTFVKMKQMVVAGQTIGNMGGRGPGGSGEYPDHLHYAVKSPLGLDVDPKEYWNNIATFDLFPGKNAPMTPVSHLDLQTQLMLKGLSQGYTIQNGETLRREGDHIWRIKADGSTRGYFIS